MLWAWCRMSLVLTLLSPGVLSFPRLQVSAVLMEGQCHVTTSSSFLFGFSSVFYPFDLFFFSFCFMLPVGASLEFPGSKCTLLTTCGVRRRGRLLNRLLQSAVHDLEFLVSPVCVSNRRCSVLHVKLSSFFLSRIGASTTTCCRRFGLPELPR